MRRCTQQLLPLARIAFQEGISPRGARSGSHLACHRVQSSLAERSQCCCVAAGLLLLVDVSYGDSCGAAPTAPCLPTRYGTAQADLHRSFVQTPAATVCLAVEAHTSPVFCCTSWFEPAEAGDACAEPNHDAGRPSAVNCPQFSECPCLYPPVCTSGRPSG